jgi:hypothetical protein
MSHLLIITPTSLTEDRHQARCLECGWQTTARLDTVMELGLSHCALWSTYAPAWDAAVSGGVTPRFGDLCGLAYSFGNREAFLTGPDDAAQELGLSGWVVSVTTPSGDLDWEERDLTEERAISLWLNAGRNATVEITIPLTFDPSLFPGIDPADTAVIRRWAVEQVQEFAGNLNEYNMQVKVVNEP